MRPSSSTWPAPGASATARRLPAVFSWAARSLTEPASCRMPPWLLSRISAAGHVQLRRAAQHHAVAALQRQLAAGQHDGAVHAHIGARPAQFRAQFLHGCRLRARQRRHADVAPGRDLVHGPRQTGQQRRCHGDWP
ncbi:hypothetical protein G6F40_015832 [Rhizopus arrhizus]|nr:hypothetical protein G6F40_015832 [Rhizopus arrhizus]